MTIFTDRQHGAFMANHEVWGDVAEAIEAGTNNPDFAVQMLEVLLAAAKRTQSDRREELDALLLERTAR